MSVSITIPKKSNAKECSNYCKIALILHASKVMLKILQARLQQYMNRELPDILARFRKGRGTRGEGDGTLLPYSCLGNPMDGGAGGLQSVRSRRVGHD